MYTKHKWGNDKYFNFSYAQYLPKDFQKTKNIRLFYFYTERESEAMISIISTINIPP